MKLKDTVHFNWYKHLFLVLLLMVCIGTSIADRCRFCREFWKSGSDDRVYEAFFLIFSYIPKIVELMLLTIKMSVVGTVACVILAVPFAFLATVVCDEEIRSLRRSCVFSWM